MEDLMHALFNSVKTEADRYLELSRYGTSPAECEIARQRCVVLYEQLEKCGLVGKYNAWKRGYDKEE